MQMIENYLPSVCACKGACDVDLYWMRCGGSSSDGAARLRYLMVGYLYMWQFYLPQHTHLQHFLCRAIQVVINFYVAKNESKLDFGLYMFVCIDDLQ